MNNWQIFAWLFDQLDRPFEAAVQGIVAGLVGYLTAPLLLMISVYLAGMTAVELYRPDGNLGINTVRRLFRAALVFAVVANAATYNHYVTDFLFNTLPNELAAAVAGATHGQAVNAQAFDTLWNNAWVAGEKVYRAAPNWSLKGLLIIGVVILYWGISVASICIAFLVYVASHVLLALLIATGPAFIVLFLFPRTSRFFDGWVAAVASVIVTQVFIVALLAFTVGVETTVIQQIAATSGGAGDQVMTDVMTLIEGAAVYLMATLLAVQIPGIARGVMGGVAHSVAPYTRLVHGAITGAGQQVAQGAQRAASGAATAIRRNFNNPPGRAL